MKRASAFFRPLLLLFGFFSFYALSFLAAQDETGDGKNLITTVSITGLRRTRLATAERPLQKFIGLEAAEVSEDEVRAAIIATGILEPVSVEVKAPVLSVTVREKWAIFPVPVVMAGTGGVMAGLAFFDANALGLADKLFLAGMYFSQGWAVSAGYMHGSPGGRIPGWNAMGAYSREERHDRDQDNEDLRRFELDTISFSAGLNFPLLENSDLLTASTQLSYSDMTLRNTEEALNGPEDSMKLLGASEELSVSKNNWDGYFLSAESASLRYSFRMPLGASPFHSVRFQGTWDKPLIPGFRLSMRAGLLFDPDAPVLAESGPSAAQVSILPRDFSARDYAGFSAGLEKYIFKFSAGTLSVSAAYQVVFSRSSVLGDSFDHGAMGMITFYLNRLAIPALGLGVAYNVAEHYLQAAFSLGMSF